MPYSIEHIRCIYQSDRLEVYSKTRPVQTITVVQFGYLETQVLLATIWTRCIDTWVPHIDNDCILIIKIIQNIIPELFGKTLLTPTYTLLTEAEYI
jgi:hypothetical protein